MMKALILGSILVASVYGGHHHGSSNSKELIRREESEPVKSCPHGFRPHGKQCIKFLVAEPIALCPSNFERSVGNTHECIMFFDKVFECPKDTFQQDGACVRTTATEPRVECPDGFHITSNGRQCIRHLANPQRFFCPPETFRHDGVCIRRVIVHPELVCSKGFALTEDRRCKIVETFDCTPSSHHEESVSHKKHHLLRFLGAKDKKHTHATSKEALTLEKEHVVQKTCKKVRIESPQRICPKGSARSNKECFIDEEVPMLEKHGDMIEEVLKARFICPEGHFASSIPGHVRCLFKEKVRPHGVCPGRTEVVDNRCAKFAPILLTCPHDHILEDGQCVKKVFAPPLVESLVEFGVRFQCVGKDCNHQHHTHAKK